jgi:predicted RecA/RadA family phage recombinase
MANNQVYPYAEVLPVVCTEPAAPNAGDPVRFGFLTGVAVEDEDTITGLTVVDFGQRVWDLSVADSVGGGIAVGDTLFYDSGTDALNNTTTGTPFGYALEVVGVGATTVINVLHVPGHGAATLGAGVIAAANIAANAVETAKILNANVTLAKMAAESVDGSKIAESADAAVLGAVPLLYHYRIPDVGAPTDYDIVVTSKIRVVDAWILNTGIAAHAANDTIQFFNGANAITNAIAKTAATDIIVRATTIDDSRADIADGGTLKITATKATNIACEAYVLAYRLA